MTSYLLQVHISYLRLYLQASCVSRSFLITHEHCTKIKVQRVCMLGICLILPQFVTFYDQSSADSKHFLPNALFLCFEVVEKF